MTMPAVCVCDGHPEWAGALSNALLIPAPDLTKRPAHEEACGTLCQLGVRLGHQLGQHDDFLEVGWCLRENHIFTRPPLLPHELSSSQSRDVWTVWALPPRDCEQVVGALLVQAVDEAGDLPAALGVVVLLDELLGAALVHWPRRELPSVSSDSVADITMSDTIFW